MNKDVIYFITKEINDLYKELEMNGLKLNVNDKSELLNKLINLIKKEKEIYSYLRYDDVVEIRKYFDEVFSGDVGICVRVIDKCDELILNNFFDEFYMDVNNIKDFDKKATAYIKSLKRDVFYLKIFFLNKFLNNNGLVGNGLYLNDIIIKQCINTNIFNYSFLYSYIENELLNTRYSINVDEFCLLSNLSCQFSLFDDYTSSGIKDDVIKNDFIRRVEKILSVNYDNVFDIGNAILLLDSLAYILSVLLIDDSYLMYINKAFEKNSNDMVYYILYDNLNELNKDKKNIKILSLNNDFNK